MLAYICKCSSYNVFHCTGNNSPIRNRNHYRLRHIGQNCLPLGKLRYHKQRHTVENNNKFKNEKTVFKTLLH